MATLQFIVERKSGTFGGRNAQRRAMETGPNLLEIIKVYLMFWSRGLMTLITIQRLILKSKRSQIERTLNPDGLTIKLSK